MRVTLVADTSPAHKRHSAAKHHNATLRAAEKRMMRLEPVLAKLLVPILEEAGRVAAANFTALVTDHTAMTAAAGDDFCLPNELNKATKPVRDEVVKTVGEAALEPLGLSFDVTNPVFNKVIQQAGKQITEISKTTQRDVMKVVKKSYDAGLSIPHTAEAIQTAMTDSAFTRATMIARTELAGAVNGASLASMQIVNDELGGGAGGDGNYMKSWMTAAGAHYPRHETYEGLDGQTVHMDDYFDVGGEEVMYPGDPDGDPAETINCRCSMSYIDAQGNEADVEGMEASGWGPCGAHEPGPGEVWEFFDFCDGPVLADAAPPDWTPPSASELINIDCAVPHAQAVMETKKLSLTIYQGGEVKDTPMQTLYSQARRLGGLPDEDWMTDLYVTNYKSLYGDIESAGFGAAAKDAAAIADRVTYSDVMQLRDDSGKLVGLADYTKPLTAEEGDKVGWEINDYHTIIGPTAEDTAMNSGYEKLYYSHPPGSDVVIGRIATSGAYPGARVRVFQELAKIAGDRGVGLEARPLSQQETKFFKKMGMTEDPSDPLKLRFTNDEAKNFGAGLEPKPGPLSVPPSAPKPVVPEPTAHVETPVGQPPVEPPYDVSHLPDYAQSPVTSLSQSEALKQAEKLQVLKHSLLYRAKQQTKKGALAKAHALEQRADSVSLRRDELLAYGKKGTVPDYLSVKPAPEPVTPVEHAAVPEPTPETTTLFHYDVKDLPEYARRPVVVLTAQEAANERKKLVVLKNSLKYRQKNKATSERQRMDYQRRIDATTERIKHLDTVAGAAKPEPGMGRATPAKSPTVNQYGALKAGNTIEEARAAAMATRDKAFAFIDAKSDHAARVDAKVNIMRTLAERARVATGGEPTPEAERPRPITNVKEWFERAPNPENADDSWQKYIAAHPDEWKPFDQLPLVTMPLDDRLIPAWTGHAYTESKFPVRLHMPIYYVRYNGKYFLASEEDNYKAAAALKSGQTTTNARVLNLDAKRMDETAGPPANDFEKMVRYFTGQSGYYNTSSAATEGEDVVNRIIQTWAGSSDSDVLLSQAVQRAAEHEFGLTAKTALRRGASNEWFKSRLDAMYEEIGPGLRIVLREMYNWTQEELRAQGIKEVTLYRGMGGATKSTQALIDKGEPVELKMQPVSSFSNNVNISRSFGGTGQGRAIYGTTVPAERILGTARTGFGCLQEEEWVVLGSTKGDTAYAARGIAHDREITPEENFWVQVQRTESAARLGY